MIQFNGLICCGLELFINFQLIRSFIACRRVLSDISATYGWRTCSAQGESKIFPWGRLFCWPRYFSLR